MVKVIFHVGMGKTGTTSLQQALDGNAVALADAETRYLGMWQPLIAPEYDNWVAFQTFRQLPTDQQVPAADRLIAALHHQADAGDIHRFIFSNEQYFENVDHLQPFFDRLAERVDLRIFIWVRAVDTWLPSACAQWGVLHKTNRGPVQPFVDQAARLIGQYRHLPCWTQLYGDRVTIRPFDDRTDPVSDFGDLIGVALHGPAVRRQTRPDAVELLLRGAFNTQFDETVLPDAFNAAIGRHRPLTAAQGLVAKADLLLGRDALPRVIAQHRDMLDRASVAAGFDVAGRAAGPDDLPSDLDLMDRMLGRAVEIIGGQARDLADLRARIEALEARAPDPA